MLHRGLLTLVVTAVTVGAGCLPPPPLPPGEERPTIESAVVEPLPVEAGQAFTVTVTARDDGPPEALVFDLDGGFLGPWVGGYWGAGWERINPGEASAAKWPSR